MPLSNGNWWDVGRAVVKGQTDVETDDIATSAVTAAKIAGGAITAAQLGAGAVDSTVLGSCSVITAKIANGAITSGKFDTGSVTAAALAIGSVLSDKLSADALRRSVICQLPDLGAATTIPLTSAFTVWTPSKAVQVAAFYAIPQADWIQTTLQTSNIGTLYAGAGAAIGTFGIPSSSGPLRGSVLSGTVSSAYSVASGQAITFGMTAATSAGYDQPAMALIIDYDSTA